MLRVRHGGDPLLISSPSVTSSLCLCHLAFQETNQISIFVFEKKVNYIYRVFKVKKPHFISDFFLKLKERKVAKKMLICLFTNKDS